MKNIILLSYLLFVFSIINAQEVISTGGDYFDNGTISLSWTIGEPVTETISNGSNILTQGFHQTKLSVIGIYDISSDDISISVFPNPTQDYINLKVGNNKDLSFQLFSFNGKLIQANKIFSKNTEIQMNNLSASTYFLKIINGNKLIKTYQIIKQ